MVKVLVLYVFHKFDDNVDHFFKHCIFEDENIDFLIIANDINFKFNLVNLPKYVMTMVRKNIGRDFGGWSEGLLKDQLYEKYDKFIFANSTIMGPFIQDNTRWTDYYINGLRDNIKLFGSTINNAYHSHVQTYVFSLDKEALAYLIEIGKFSITKYLRSARDAQNNEILMSKDITDKGWNIGCLLKCYHGIDFTFKNKSKKDYGDKLHTDIMYEKYRNVLWDEYEVVFIKGNRVKITSS